MKKYSSTTKVNYRRTSPKKRFWFGAVLVLMVLGFVLPWLISQTATIVLYPFHATTTWIKESNGEIPTFLRGRQSLVSEIESLRAEVSTEVGTQASINRLQAENIQLRTLLNISTSTEKVIAKVIARPGTLIYDTLQINQGSKQGLEVGMPVYSRLDTVVGVISHTAFDYAFVQLFTTPQFEATAYIVGPNIFATIEGMGGGVARVRLPQGVQIAVGDTVLLPAVSGGVYGEIAWIENHPTQPEQYGYVVPPIALNGLHYVAVDTDTVETRSEIEIEEGIKDQIMKLTNLDRDLVGSLAPKFNSDEAIFLNEHDSATTSTSTGEVESSSSTESTFQ